MKEGKTATNFEIIDEEEEEFDEVEVLEEIKAAEKLANPGMEKAAAEIEDPSKYALTLQIKPLNEKLTDAVTYNSICHTWYIVKDVGVPINWKRPLLQKSQITSKI